MQRSHQLSRVNACLMLVLVAAVTPSACSLEATPAPESRGGQSSSGSGGAGGNGEAGRNGANVGGSKGQPVGGSSGSGGTGPTGGAFGSAGDLGQAGEWGNAGDPGNVGGTGDGGTGGGAGGADSVGGAGNAASSNGGNAGMGGGPPPCTVCDGDCVDLLTTEPHCGVCGYACVNGRECVDGRCTPAWQPIATAGAPVPRSSHAAAFVAGKFVVLGGGEFEQPGLTSCGAYDPVTDRWSAIAPLQTGRCLHRAVSTGTEIYTFGGLTLCTSNGGQTVPGMERFVPDAGAGTWTSVTAPGAPLPRYNLNMVWTGSAVMVYGGSDLTQVSLPTGGLFNPSTSQWTDASCGLEACNRTAGALFMLGAGVHFMGGEYNPDYPDWFGNGGIPTSGLAYDPTTNVWSSWPHPEGTMGSLNGPQADDGRRIYFPTGESVAIFDRVHGWQSRDYSPMPTTFCGHNAAYAWSGSELIGWSGNCSPSATEVGGRYQPPAPL
jgi:hypothetical protein